MKYVLLAAVGLFYLAFVAASPVTFELDQEWYDIPTEDGEMIRMSRQEVIDFIENTYVPTNRFNAATDVFYYLHTQTFPNGVQIYLNNAQSLINAAFNPAHPVRFTIHGWNNDRTSEINTVAEFLARGNYNHIVVDWSLGSGTSNYISARNRAFEVSQHAAWMTTFLVSVGASYANMHIIGHSLGGQMAGIIGQHLGGNLIGACIAMDAAGPLFSPTNITDRMSPDDCLFVEAVHTSAGTVGYDGILGHADYFPNGGKAQPGCGWDWFGTCAHGKATKMFKNSLSLPNGYLANKCTTTMAQVNSGNCGSSGITNRMLSETTDTAASGLYYLTLTV